MGFHAGLEGWRRAIARGIAALAVLATPGLARAQQITIPLHSTFPEAVFTEMLTIGPDQAGIYSVRAAQGANTAYSYSLGPFFSGLSAPDPGDDLLLGMLALRPGTYMLNATLLPDASRCDDTPAGRCNAVFKLRFERALPPSTVTPEPVSMVLLGSGLAGVVALRRRRKRDA